MAGGVQASAFFFWGSVTATAPSRGLTDNKKKKGERAQAEEKAKGSCSRRPRTKERKPGKRKNKPSRVMPSDEWLSCLSRGGKQDSLSLYRQGRTSLA